MLQVPVWKTNTCWHYFLFFLLIFFSALWFFYIFFSIRLWWSYDLDCRFRGLTWIDLPFIPWVTSLSYHLKMTLAGFFFFVFFNQFHHYVFNRLRIELYYLYMFTKIFFPEILLLFFIYLFWLICYYYLFFII
jgi:hypothetical protein